MNFQKSARKSLAIFLPLWIAGCASVSVPPHPVSAPPRTAPVKAEPVEAPQIPRDAHPADRLPPPATARVAPQVAPAPAMSPAVLALLKDAETSRSNGRLDQAAATLERAVRIQPRNAVLWSQMAEVRLEQHQPGLAEDLAKKSNVLAKGNRDLVRKNWILIAQARREKGDNAGAADADAKAGR